MMTGVMKRLLLGGLLALVVAAPSYGKAATLKSAAKSHRATARLRTGPDSFVKYRVETVDDFLSAYDEDPVLRKRLARHFHVPEAQLTGMVHSQLQEVTFQDSHWMGTYGVKESSGEIYPVKTYVRKGTKALGLADGTPLFKIPCANPFAASFPPLEVPHPLAATSASR